MAVIPPEVDEEEELLDDELLLEELLLDEELVELEELLLEEDELLLELLEVPPPRAIVPAEAVRVTRSSREPSSRLEIRNT
jgi:hypothetical protein